jgi:stage V sporulation protein D (sporulation-specific penicillin-binding protein)
VYEPGSTFKILTTAAALDAGVTNPSEGFYCSGKVKVDGDTIRCWGNPHGAETMQKALQNSCNPVFVELGLRLGTERFYRYLRAFGLGNPTGVDLPGEGEGLLIGQRYVKNVDLARIGFGQSVAVTPLQLLTAACSVVNGGKLMRPYIVKEVVAQDGTVLERTRPRVVSTPIKPETSAVMRELLESVVAEGGGRNAAVDGYRIGGKTGTAQVYRNGKIVRDVHIGSFLGFAPADNPRIALLVIVDEADVPVDYGGTTASPFARQILMDTLAYLSVAPQLPAGATPKPEVSVPELRGLSVAQARAALHEAGLNWLVDGEEQTVIDQMPPVGATMAAGSIVMLYVKGESPPSVEDFLSVPDVRGLSIVEANRALRARGFDLYIEGTGVAVRQKPTAGEFAAPDTVVKVTFEAN